ncbi:diaminopimelate decarboxylase [Candidatus Peregrinibacteria bacterium]|nr:diaminopimelate decarboxylase [Candidatus Peregrinibacteria bacterium]
MPDKANQQVLYFPKEGIMKSVQQFPTPFFVYEEKKLRENCRNLKKTFEKYFPYFQPLYAVKANNNPTILKIIMEEGFGFDCSSESECRMVKKICEGEMKMSGNVNTMKVVSMYTGNYTPVETLKFAKDCGMILNLDDVSNVAMLKEFCGGGGQSAVGDDKSVVGVPETLSFRVNPGIGKGGMESVVTAGPDAKFGVPFEKAAEAYKLAQEAGVKHFGIHMMTGSNVLDEEYFAKVVEKLLEIVADVKNKTGIKIEFLNIGGGFGVAYRPEEKSLDLDKVARLIKETFDKQCAKFGIKAPRLIAEPGRYITADMGFLVGKVVVIKDGYKKFVGIDAASNDMPRPSIYGAYHYVSVMKKGEFGGRVIMVENKKFVSEKSITGDTLTADRVIASSKTEVVSVVGSICENNDQFAKDRELPVCETGDIIVIHNCGGHAFAMGHHYNGKLLHAEYLLQENGELRMIRRAETFEDLYRTTTDFGRTKK